MTKAEKLELLCTASLALLEAEDALSKIVGDGGYIAPDAGYYLHQIRELLSCDDGEAGLNTLIKSVEKDVQGEL